MIRRLIVCVCEFVLLIAILAAAALGGAMIMPYGGAKISGGFDTGPDSLVMYKLQITKRAKPLRLSLPGGRELH